MVHEVRDAVMNTAQESLVRHSENILVRLTECNERATTPAVAYLQNIAGLKLVLGLDNGRNVTGSRHEVTLRWCM